MDNNHISLDICIFCPKPGFIRCNRCGKKVCEKHKNLIDAKECRVPVPVLR